MAPKGNKNAVGNNGGRPLLFDSVEELKEKCDSYFTDCLENDEPYTITGLALALGTSRQTLINYEERPEFFDTIKEAKLKCENYAEKILLTGKNQTGAIFALKNYDWEDRQKVEHDGSIDQPDDFERVKRIAAILNSGRDRRDRQSDE